MLSKSVSLPIVIFEWDEQVHSSLDFVIVKPKRPGYCGTRLPATVDVVCRAFLPPFHRAAGKGSKPGPDDVIFVRVMPLLGKKIKINSSPKRAELGLSLPLAVWRLIDAAQKENGCDTDTVLARIIEDK